MDVNQRVKVLEDEVKVLKAELKSVLLDIREQYLNNQNPFANPGRAPGEGGAGDNGDTPAAPTVIVRESVVERDRAPKRPAEESEQVAEAPSNGHGTALMNDTTPALTGLLPKGSGHSAVRVVEERPQEVLDLAVIAGLTEWVDKTIQRIGKHRTEAIAEGFPGAFCGAIAR